jgi:hypothetical protein
MESEVYFNRIYVIQSLPAKEKQTGTNLYNDIIRVRAQQNFDYLTTELIDINTKQEFVNALTAIKKAMSTEGIAPYLHFELHGSKKGLSIKDGQLISWYEMYPFLRDINVMVKNNLFISLATCYGAYILEALTPLDRAPFFAYVGPQTPIYVHELEMDWESYFDTLLTERDVNKAIEALNRNHPQTRYHFLSSQYFLDEVTKKFVATLNNRRARRDKLKALRKRAIKEDPTLRSSYTRERMDAVLKEQINNMPKATLAMKSYFLMQTDEPPPF